MAHVAAALLLAACATPTTAEREEVPSRVYPLPLDNALDQTALLLEKKGWHVQRAGNVLVTNWRGGEGLSTLSYQAGVSGADFTTSLVEYRVFGQRIDSGYSTIRIERLVATRSSLDFGQKKGGHQVDLSTNGGQGRPTAVHNEQRELMPAFNPSEYLPEFAQDSANDSAETGVPPGMVVSLHSRETALEQELDAQVGGVVATRPAEKSADAVSVNASADAGVSSVPQQGVSAPQRLDTSRLTALSGIWDGTFSFRGKVAGSFSGELPVAVHGDTVEIEDFCPERGGLVAAHGSGNSAAWDGTLACPSIRLNGCRAAAFTYTFVLATLTDETLTVTASGTVTTDPTCLDSGGEFSGIGGTVSVTYVARKADYIHLVVSRAKGETVCVWPKDWEDFASRGSMPMPDATTGDAAYLGIIRAKGSRLTDIRRLLRHCHQVVLLRGQPVLMRLAVTRPRE